MQHWPDRFVVISTRPDPSNPRLIGEAIVEFRGYRSRIDRAPLLDMASTAKSVVDRRSSRAPGLCVCASRREPEKVFLKAPPVRLLDDDECYDD